MIHAEHAVAAVHEFEKLFFASEPRVPHISMAGAPVAGALLV